MPIYEYKCAGCGHAFEKLMRNRQETPGLCPQCGADALRKQFSSFSARTGSENAGREACPAAAACPSGTCCGGGACPF